MATEHEDIRRCREELVALHQRLENLKAETLRLTGQSLEPASEARKEEIQRVKQRIGDVAAVLANAMFAARVYGL